MKLVAVMNRAQLTAANVIVIVLRAKLVAALNETLTTF